MQQPLINVAAAIRGATAYSSLMEDNRSYNQSAPLYDQVPALPGAPGGFARFDAFYTVRFLRPEFIDTIVVQLGTSKDRDESYTLHLFETCASDGAVWEPVAPQDTQRAYVFTASFPPRRAQMVRMQGTAPTSGGLHITRFQAFFANPQGASAMCPPGAEMVGCSEAKPCTEYRKGMTGVFTCTHGGCSGTVWGSGPYTSDSQICACARHAGVIGPTGGHFVVKAAPGQSAYQASDHNGVSTRSYGSYDSSVIISPYYGIP